ncbi:ATP-binding protein [Pedobacter jejuensis]|uniref:ATP-binding protein n=1 Tax=Pedobacter jejuensis TaxID=1268550 RepID=A0A3N0BZH2_9SPHI|nr:ATP-binding protein [Pedobacter jejuensis]
MTDYSNVYNRYTNVNLNRNYTKIRISKNGGREEIGQVITNYISNAIKHSGSGEAVEIEINCTEKDLAVGVTDHGIGKIPGIRRDSSSAITG